MGRLSGSLLIAVLAVTACKSTGNESKSEPAPPSGAAAGTAPSDGQVTDITKVPVSMWSSAQRQSTASYYFLVGEYVTLKERDAKKSLQLFETAYSLDPNPFLGGKMLAAKAAAGDRPEAMLEARKMVLLYPRDAQLRFFYGEMLTQAGELTEAVTQLEKCVELDPHYEAAYLQLADLYQNMKQSAKAIVVAKELVKNAAGSVAGWSQLSRLYLVNGQVKNSLVPARRAWEMQSANPQLTQIYAISLQLNGKMKQAVRMYEQLYRLDPTDEELTSRMVELYRELGNLESAIQLLDEMIKQGGQSKPAVQMQKAILLWELKRNTEATQLLDELVRAYPESDRVHYLAGFSHERLQQFDQALAYYHGIAEGSPLYKDGQFRTLLILKEQKKKDEAYALAQKLRDLPQASWEVLGILADVFADTKHYAEALAVIEDGIKRFPDRYRLLFLKGVYQEKAGDRDGCIQTMRLVLKVDPDNSSAYNFLGYLYAEKGENLVEAEKLVQKSLALKPDDGFYLDSLGWVYFQKGELGKAAATLDKAARLEPKEGVIYEHLGDVRNAQGDKKAAHELYRKALGANLDDQDRSRIEAKAKVIASPSP
jgi:tetratricopeptide (TPR) repeat protein